MHVLSFIRIVLAHTCGFSHARAQTFLLLLLYFSLRCACGCLLEVLLASLLMLAELTRLVLSFHCDTPPPPPHTHTHTHTHTHADQLPLSSSLQTCSTVQLSRNKCVRLSFQRFARRCDRAIRSPTPFVTLSRSGCSIQ